MARDDRDMGVEVGRDETERRSSSHKDKSRKDSGSKRHRDGDKEKDRDKDREGTNRRSSKHSRDKEKESGHSSSSRKRERSEERTTRDRSHDRSKERELREEDDRSHKGDDDRKRRRREEGSSRSSSSRKSKHRDKDGKSGGSSGKHKSKDKDKKGDGKNKERHKDRHRSKGDKEHAEAASVDRGEPNGDGKRHSPEGENKTSNGDPGNIETPLAVSEVVDGEEEGEVILEPKKPAPLPKAPAEHRDDNVNAEKENGAGDTSEKATKAGTASEDVPSKEAAVTVPVPMTDEQAEEAARLARIAARAEERAAERAKARAAAKAASGSTAAPSAIPAFSKVPSNGSVGSGVSTGTAAIDQIRAGDVKGGKIGGIMGAGLATAKPLKPAFKTKKQREQEALQRLEEQRRARRKEQEEAAAERGKSERQRQAEEDRQRQKARELEREEARAAREKEKEMESLRDHYLGKKKVKKKIVKPSEKFSKIFQFDWDASEDTSRDANPLYNQRAQLNASFGRGYLAGIDMREQRKDSAFLTALMQKRQEEQRHAEEADDTLTAHDKAERERMRAQQMAEVAAFSREEADGLGDDPTLKGAHWSEKPLVEMSDRDWRIFREDFDIRVKGGKAPLPLRFWEEGHLPSSVMEAIRELGYEKPSPIQRQAIPIGMERRDIIGIAETGSGKTAAFGIPMIAYILSLDPIARERVAEQGPLALIMAPTRELAMQIEEECKKFCKFAGLHTVCVVGGQSIEQQAFNLRKGVEIIIGTPGRLNDCVEKHYLVLNQCHYVVLDEADRMIDMGFEDQVLAVLDAMGGTLKADNEEQAYLQELRAKEARNTKDLVRVTAMFSATMPPAVERMAKKYLRHPAIVQIGDEDTGKNRRIDQRVIWTTESQKKTQVLDILRRYGPEDRVLVFINTKKSADILGRQLEQAGFSTVVLHGGKTQDQREDNLESFREGIYTVLVATDVASRGLDIPDVKEVINYELPSKIETYCHRIGRTGRAGKDGIATSFLTEHDEEIMFGLKEYLQSTESHVPPQLAKHNAAQAAVGARREDGTLVNSKRDMVMFSKK